MATIDVAAIAGIKSQIDAAVQEADGIPGLQYYAVNKEGGYIFEHSAGKIGVGKQNEMKHSTSFWIASCTKLLTTIACMQLVEQGKLALDNVGLVEKLSPELKEVQVLENGKLIPKERGITLRMLLSHTAGFSYSFFHPGLADYMGPIGLCEMSGRPDDYLTQPLVNQPGKLWAYGISMDWAGVLVTRATGLTLDEYFHKYITDPLNIGQDISFVPDSQMRQDLAYLHHRAPTGQIELREDGHLLRAPLVANNSDEASSVFQSGGAGCFARPRAFAQIIATLLNDGVHHPTSHRLLEKETVEMMFTNQLPHMPDFARQGGTVPKKEYANEIPELYPEPGNPPQGWGISFFLHLQDSMIHSKGTGWWAGLPNLFWWCDRTKGVGGLIASQILPFGDMKVIGLWASVEGGLYANVVPAPNAEAPKT